MSQHIRRVPEGLHMLESTACLIAIFLVIGSLGCGSGSPTTADLEAWMQDYHRERDSVWTLDSISLVRTEKQADKGVKLEFQVHEQLKTDIFLPATLVEAFAEYKYDPSQFERAKRELVELREPERTAAASSLPEPPPLLQIFRRTGSVGDKLTWKGTVIASKGEASWEFADPVGRIDADTINEDNVARQELPQDAVLIEQESAENAVTQIIAKQKDLIQAVAEAGQRMNERLEREHQRLLAIIKSNQVFEASLPVTSGPVQKLSVRFAYQENEGEMVVALFENVADKLVRASWKGELTLIDPPQQSSTMNAASEGSRPQPDGWSIKLTPVEGEDQFPQRGVRNEITLGLSSDDRLTWFNLTSPLTLEEATPSPPLPDYKIYAAQVQQWTAPGHVWEGTIQSKGDVSRNVRLTFTEFRDQGNYVRAILETSIDEYAVAIFEGTVTTTPEGIFSWPVKLEWISGEGTKFQGTEHEISMITHGGALKLAFTSAGECFGMSRDAGSLSPNITVALKPAVAFVGFHSSPSRWKNGLQAGTRWSGKIVRGDTAAEKIALTVCEVDEDGRSYQMTIQNPANPHQFRAFEGTLDNADKATDGYALVVEAKSSVAQPTHFGYSGYADVYGVHRDAKHQFRLSADGRTLWGISGAKELIQLTREQPHVARSLDRKSVVEAWRETCVQGNRWKGRLTNTEMKLSTDVEMKVTSGVDALGTVEVELSIPKRAKTEMTFRGSLRLDDDGVHAFALILHKQEENRGQGESLVFGSSHQGVELNFRLADDGKGLIGMAADGEHAKEFLELQKVESSE